MAQTIHEDLIQDGNQFMEEIMAFHLVYMKICEK